MKKPVHELDPGGELTIFSVIHGRMEGGEIEKG